MLLILLVLLIVGAFGSAPWYPYSTGWGYYPSSGMIVIAIILLFLMSRGRF